jgi:prophage maintenance system killer protein
MIRYLTLAEVIELHRAILEQVAGSGGIRDLGALESAIAQPRMTFGGEELYPTITEKASASGFSIVMNHPFVDGNRGVTVINSDRSTSTREESSYADRVKQSSLNTLDHSA